jgi:tetratricopeptide (TPR) repeat protein
MLQVLADRFATAGALVSFNGKSFDAPLLESRFLFHRLDWLGARLPHVDILHPARRFWRAESSGGEVSSCSLSALERQVLGAERHGDVAGYEVPARYFQFVRSGDARLLSGVLAHNRLDLLSLAGLTAQLLGLVANGAGGASSAREALALGRVYEQAGLVVKAQPAWERALILAPLSASGQERPDPGLTSERLAIRIEALRALARAARRARRYIDAAAYWQEVVDTSGCPPSAAREAAEALAIHHEHRVRDLESARGFALRTLDHSAARARNEAVRYRLARLERKLTETLLCPRLQFGD